jgi:hypothetical protein
MVVVRIFLRLVLSLHDNLLTIFTVFTVWSWGSDLLRESLERIFR